MTISRVMCGVLVSCALLLAPRALPARAADGLQAAAGAQRELPSAPRLPRAALLEGRMLAAVLMYRVIYEIIPVLFALALWGAFEGFSRDGALLRVFNRQGRNMRAESPAIDSSE